MNHLPRSIWPGALALLLLAAACANTSPISPDGGDGSVDPGPICTETTGDQDSDGIPNGVEGCESGLDTDGDQVPDWKDLDSDNDGLPDYVERGQKDAEGHCDGAAGSNNSWPCDSDGDGKPDYRDTDSDDDGLLDKDEDFNGDGLLGCCLAFCNEPKGVQPANCALNAEGCGPGQACQGGRCTPPKDFRCSAGETDPRQKDTFGDGVPDKERGTFICREATAESPLGRKAVQLQQHTVGDWRVALEKTALYHVPQVTGIPPQAAAALIDERDASKQVAGFIVSRSGTDAKIAQEQLAVIGSLLTSVPGGKGVLDVRSLGSAGKSHDKFDTIIGTLLDIRLLSSANVARVRNEIVTALLGRKPQDLQTMPSEFGDSATEFVVRLVIVRRFEFKRDPAQPTKLVLDEKGFPVDSGDTSKWRLVVMGAVAAKAHLEDVAHGTQVVVSDLSNGTTLALADDGIADECAVATIPSTPAADIIWVVDDSGSMQDNLADVAANAKDFFDRALASGMDFRMAVTGTVPKPDPPTNPSLQGKFCSVPTRNDGGDDRFLLPGERAIFEGCIANPPGSSMGQEAGLESARASIERHLPRAASDPTKIRTGAVLVVILATDELPQEFKEKGLFPDQSGNPVPVPCTLGAADQTLAEEITGPFRDFFTGKTPGSAETKAIVHYIGGVCGNNCEAQVGHGYLSLSQATGGLTVDVCQSKLGSSLQEIINHVIGASSPVVLEYVPISTTLAVAVGQNVVERSRVKGFDYVPATNSLAFFGIPFPKGARVVTSYRRWMKQAPIQ